MVEEHWRELTHRWWQGNNYWNHSGRETCGGMRGDRIKGLTMGDVGHGLGMKDSLRSFITF